jgi:RNA polymerase sigma factor (sigma-70 family)
MILEGNDPRHFQFFAEQVRSSIATYGSMNKKQLLEQQRAQVNGLSQLELDFIEALKLCGIAKEAFNCFYDYIINERRNLLAARPFFRERSDKFAEGLMGSIKNRDYTITSKYHLNFHFCDLVVKRLDFSKDKEVLVIYKKIKQLRQDLVLMNLPLIISRARMFYSRTPKSHLSFMDLVQIGVGGLISAIDKYCGTYARVWRAVVIGRCAGDQIRVYSSTVLHFYPDDRRRLYRANKYLARRSPDEICEEDLLKAVNDSCKHPTDGNTLRNLIQAAGIVSVDVRAPVDDEKEGNENVVRMAAPESSRPDVQFEENEGTELMFKCIAMLPIIDQKILRLKGVEKEMRA